MELKDYKVSDSQIEMIAILLIKQNSSTTNLDIKKQFRSSGFYITQDEVSAAMTRMEQSGRFKSVSNGNHRIFSMGTKLNQTQTAKPTVVVKASTPKTVKISISQSTGRSNRNTSIAKTASTSTTFDHSKLTPISFTCNDSTAFINDLAKVYKNSWVATDGTSTLYLHGSITRSKARVRFSKATGSHYNTITCKRVK